MLPLLQAREAAKSGMVVFNGVVEEFFVDVEQTFGRFERAAAEKGHEESLWVVSVLKDVEMEKSAWKEAFAKTEQPLGWYFVGLLSDFDSRERFDAFKKSAAGRCSWGQAYYAFYLKNGSYGFVEEDTKSYLEWLEMAAKQNNPLALYLLGEWFLKEGEHTAKAVSYHRAAAELGWKESMTSLANMLRHGEGCERDVRSAAMWFAKEKSRLFWRLVVTARLSYGGTTPYLEGDLDQLCYTLGAGLYWEMYGSTDWKEWDPPEELFGLRCLDYYCSSVELQQKSIFTFLLFWNRTTGGIKGPGQMIGKMVWEGREENLVKEFEKF
jgi:hypothetical protein